jgi:5-methylcytosine-specific restriction endonuclease McrA
MSKRSRACEISQKTKEIVWNRDNNRCIYCGKYVPMVCANAHFIKRSQGGLGIPENIVTLCPECHYQEDFGQDTKLYEDYIEKYLKNIYGTNWSKEKLIYKKY